MIGYFWQFFTQTLRGRLLLLTLFPLILLSVLLTLFFVFEERAELEGEYHNV